MTCFICTAGTSVMGGRFRPQDFSDIAAQIANHRRTKDAGDDIFRMLVLVSAETNGLVRAGCGPGDEVVILQSDTEDGLACADAVAAIVSNLLGAKPKVRPVAGLQVSDAGAFRQRGIRNLIQIAGQEAARAKQEGQRVIFNVTGGFKGVVPYLTLLGMLQDIEMMYVFDGSETLIQLPALPIYFDHTRFASALPRLQCLHAAGQMTKDEFTSLWRDQKWQNDPDLALLFEEDRGDLALTAVGEIALATWRRPASAGRLFVHRRARQSGHFEEHGVRRTLAALLDEDFRDIDRHSARHRNTDMNYSKAGSGPAARIFYWLDGEDVYVADILPHNTYTNEFLTGQTPIWKTNYAADQFSPYNTTADAEVSDAYGEALGEFLTVVNEERIRLETRVRHMDGQLEALRNARTSDRRHAEQRETELRQEIADLRKANDDYRAVAEAEKAALLAQLEEAGIDGGDASNS